MPWSHSSPMDQRISFIRDYIKLDVSVTELCEQYHISRKTGYKWIRRHENEGLAGLEDRSSQPHGCPHQTPDVIVQALLDARSLHPFWGAKKLRKILGNQHPDWELPARSTICDILARYGMVPEPRRRRRPGHPGKPTTVAAEPNDLWCSDYKGEFKTLDGIYCYPLTVTDAHSRFLLACTGLDGTATEPTKEAFMWVFREYGLPKRIRTDNGTPFASSAIGRLSRLSVWWIRLGIVPELIEPGKPQQNGQHERMHRTLKDQTTRPPAATRRSQQVLFDDFRQEFNHDRPHESLDQEPPASLYRPSPRPMPSKLPPLEYPAHFEKRYVSENGAFRWKSHPIPLSETCEHAYVGLEEVDNGVWNIYLGPVRLGRLLEESMSIEDNWGRLHRRKL